MMVAITTASILLLTVSSASAECAWLMWNRANAPTAPEAWTIGTAFGNRKACTHEISKRAKGWKNTGWNVVFDTDARIAAKSQAGVNELICLPDSADPRAPKGR